ncbi:acyl carrier protein [Streptomyces sp. NPDC046275]|uniref:acyl carrier protein n=1 Tax=Streptomyces sp. NPDC046275 TaxID=3157201 RepID=UPI0033FEC47C
MTTHPAQPSAPAGLTRSDLVAILASYGDREPGDVAERIDSLELAWVVHSVEERFDTELDLDDAQLARMVTLDDVLDVLGGALADATAAPGGDRAGTAH